MRTGAHAPLRRAVIAVASCASVVAVVLIVPTVARAAPSPFTITQHAPVQQGTIYAVEFGERQDGHGRLTGHLTGAPPGTTVTLQARRFPFRHAFRSVATTTTSSTGRFHFPVQPTLATKYRAKALAFTSRVVTFYVVSGEKQIHQQTCQTRPRCTVGGTFRQFYPALLARKESAKRVFVYKKVKLNCCAYPSPPRKLNRTSSATVRRHKVNATTYRFTFKIPLNVPTQDYYYYRWASCQRETEAKDGFGLPKHLGPCGGPTVAYRYFAHNLAS